MKRVLILVVLTALSAFAGTAWAAETSALAKLNGGNIVQSISDAANEKDGYFKAPITNTKMKVSEVAVISIDMESAKQVDTKSGSNALSSTTSLITLNKDTGYVKDIVFLVQWNKNAASALDAFLAAGFVTKIMGKLTKPGATEDGLHKLYKALLGEKPGEFLDGKERIVHVHGTKCSAHFLPNIGLALAMSEDTK